MNLSLWGIFQDKEAAEGLHMSVNTFRQYRQGGEAHVRLRIPIPYDFDALSKVDLWGLIDAAVNGLNKGKSSGKSPTPKVRTQKKVPRNKDSKKRP